MPRFLLNYPAMGDVTRLPKRVKILGGSHHPTQCEGEGCVIHHPSDHHMVEWPLNWRPKTESFEIGGPLMERVCQHGVGHPDPDHIAAVRKTLGEAVADADQVHGCDGCCISPEDK